MTMMRKMTEIFLNQMKIIEHFCVCGTIVILKHFTPSVWRITFALRANKLRLDCLLRHFTAASLQKNLPVEY